MVVVRTAAAVTTGRWVRLLLLLCTLIGLAAMHTLGHGAHGSGGPGSAGHRTGHPAAEHVAAPAGMALAAGCPGDGCRPDAVLPLGHLGGELSGWSVCLAVLGTFAVALLVAVLLRLGSRPVGPAARGSVRLSPGPRAPPPRPLGLRLATASVLRR